VFVIKTWNVLCETGTNSVKSIYIEDEFHAWKQESSSVCLVLHLLSPPSPTPSLLVILLLLLLLLCSGFWLSAAVAERDTATHLLTSTIINRTRSQAGIHYKYCTASVSPSASLWSASSNTLLHRWVIDLLRGERAGQLGGVRNWVGLLEHPSHPVQDQQFPPPSLSHNLWFQSSPKEKYSRLWLVYSFHNDGHYRRSHSVIWKFCWWNVKHPKGSYRIAFQGHNGNEQLRNQLPL